MELVPGPLGKTGLATFEAKVFRLEKELTKLVFDKSSISMKLLPLKNQLAHFWDP